MQIVAILQCSIAPWSWHTFYQPWNFGAAALSCSTPYLPAVTASIAMIRRITVIRLLALCLFLLGGLSALVADAHADVQMQCLDVEQTDEGSFEFGDDPADADDLVHPPRIKAPVSHARHASPSALAVTPTDACLPPRLRPPTLA